MPLEVSRHAVGSRTLIRVRLLDRRLAHPVEDEFLFQHDVEQCLYGGNNGALHQLYARCVHRRLCAPGRSDANSGLTDPHPVVHASPAPLPLSTGALSRRRRSPSRSLQSPPS